MEATRIENLGAVAGRVETWEGINRLSDGEKNDDFRANRSEDSRRPVFPGGAMDLAAPWRLVVGAKAISMAAILFSCLHSYLEDVSLWIVVNKRDDDDDDYDKRIVCVCVWVHLIWGVGEAIWLYWVYNFLLQVWLPYFPTNTHPLVVGHFLFFFFFSKTNFHMFQWKFISHG